MPTKLTNNQQLAGIFLHLTKNNKQCKFKLLKSPQRLFKKGNFFANMNKIITFIKEAKEELLKVNWPSKKQTLNYTLIVIGVSLAVAVFLGGLDYIFNYLLKVFII